jgi:hypothetical protein
VRLVRCFAGINALESIQPGLALDQMGEFGSYTRILSSILPGVTPGERDIVTRSAIPPGRMLMIPWKEARDVLVQNLDPAMIHYGHTFVHYTPIQVSILHTRHSLRYVSCTRDTHQGSILFPPQKTTKLHKLHKLQKLLHFLTR